MRLICIHGYFKFFEEEAGEVVAFMNLTDVDLTLVGDYFTFDALVDAPNYSIKGALYLGVIAKTNFEGEPWEVMRANDIVYDFTQGKAVLIETITALVSFVTCSTYFSASGMIIPGSITDDGERVTDYAAFFEDPSYAYSEIISG